MENASHNNFTTNEKPKPSVKVNYFTQQFESKHYSKEKSSSCIFCNSVEHNIYKCPIFKKLSVDERISFTKEKHLCFNCIKPHNYNKCQARFCTICNKKHNALLHIHREKSTASGETSQKSLPEETAVTCFTSAKSTSQILMSTAIVKVYKNDNTYLYARALLDSASQSHFITKKLYKALGVESTPQPIQIMSLSQAKMQANNTACRALQYSLIGLTLQLNLLAL